MSEKRAITNTNNLIRIILFRFHRIHAYTEFIYCFLITQNWSHRVTINRVCAVTKLVSIKYTGSENVISIYLCVSVCVWVYVYFFVYFVWFICKQNKCFQLISTHVKQYLPINRPFIQINEINFHLMWPENYQNLLTLKLSTPPCLKRKWNWNNLI